MREKDMFEPIKRFMINEMQCNAVYGEILDHDILALLGSVNVIVEMKTSLNFKVIEQAEKAKMYAHLVYVAVPESKSRTYGKEILKKLGIGLMIVRDYLTGSNYDCHIILKARFDRRPNLLRDTRSNIRNWIPVYADMNIGGVKGGDKITDYSWTMEAIKRYMRRENRWLTIKEILDNVETHYSDPKPSLMATLQKSWNSDWCEIKVESGKRLFRYKKGAEG